MMEDVRLEDAIDVLFILKTKKNQNSKPTFWFNSPLNAAMLVAIQPASDATWLSAGNFELRSANGRR